MDSPPTLPLLLARYSAARAEIADIAKAIQVRGIARTNNIVGELGERLALDVYGGTLVTTSHKDIDLLAKDGRRLQVKTRALPPKDLRVYDFASLELDAAICIRFDVETFSLDWAKEFDTQALEALVNKRPHGFRLTGTRVRDHGLDVTEQFRAAWADLQRNHGEASAR